MLVCSLNPGASASRPRGRASEQQQGREEKYKIAHEGRERGRTADATHGRSGASGMPAFHKSTRRFVRPPARRRAAAAGRADGRGRADRYAARISDRKERRTCACETFWSRGRRPRRRRRRHRNPDHRRLRNIADLEFWTAAKISGEWAARSKNLVME